MDELIKALDVRIKYNRMTLEDFILEYEKYFNVKIPDNVINDYKMIGLNNCDFITYAKDIGY